MKTAKQNSHKGSKISLTTKNKESICAICFDDLTIENVHVLTNCKCSFCKNCLDDYFQYMIDTGHLRIYCPSFKCILKNPIPLGEINELLTGDHKTKFQKILNEKFLNNNGFDDQNNNENNDKIQCPFCEGIFDSLNSIQEVDGQLQNEEISDEQLKLPIFIFKCPNCSKISCSRCSAKLSGEDTKHDCRDLNENILNEFDIKRCPNCNFLIQREGGCAQISCRNCCHIFCWHCLKSLDNDFLLFHYDSGPCKNKLGHSRLSIFFNRAQTISLCVGISILMLLASPVIIALLPCVLTKKCRTCCKKRKDSVPV